MDRRAFVGLLGGGTLTWPRALQALDRVLAGGGSADDEAYWALVRGQFLIPPDRLYLNNGTLGPSPRVVVEATAEHARRVAATYPPGVHWDDLKRAMSDLVGGDPEGFVFPRNTTEAMSFVAGGLELERGGDVVTTDHEHIGGLEPWKMVTARRGMTLTVARLPVPATSGEQLLDAIWGAVTPDTRVVSVSHVTFTNGTVLPVADLARRCAREGIVFTVDGAHPPGMMELDVAEVGADFYASSPHKWLLAPQGTGLLYLAEPWRTRLWPVLASGGWDDLSLGAQRFNHLGTFDESRLAGLLAAAEFMQVLGMPRVEARVRYLRGLLQTALESVPGVTVFTPGREDLRAGMVSFKVEGIASLDLQAQLARTDKVRTRVISEYGHGWMRLSTHVYNHPGQIQRVVDLIEAASRRS